MLHKRERQSSFPIEKNIRNLAEKFQVSTEKSNLDFVADKFSELCGDDIEEDEVTQLIINLVRAGHITKIEGLKHMYDYLSEKYT